MKSSRVILSHLGVHSAHSHASLPIFAHDRTTMACTSALILLLALVRDCAAFTLTPNKAMALHRQAPAAVSDARGLAMVRMEEDAAEAAAPPAQPAYEPTDAEISDCMRTLPRDGWEETVAMRRAKAIKLLKEKYDPAAIAKVCDAIGCRPTARPYRKMCALTLELSSRAAGGGGGRG